MKKSSVIRVVYIVTLVVVLMLLQGCASLKPRQMFNHEVDELLTQLLQQSSRQTRPLQPVAVVSVAARDGKTTNRLEEALVEKLTNRLTLQQSVYTLTRQNWFELREGRPLTFSGQSAANHTLLQQLIVYEVWVESEPVLEHIRMQITASDATGRDVVGIMAEKEFNHSDSQPWQKVFVNPARNNPYPQGLEEHPYTSLDRFAYSLASELTDSYRAGVQIEGQQVADEDIHVVLCAKDQHPQSLAILNAVQQAIVAQQGFTSSLSQSDMGAVFNQLEWYENNQSVFHREQSAFAPGTVFLLIDVQPTTSEILSVSLRAIWRDSPLETHTGALIPSNYSGSYLSGFTAKAYLSQHNLAAEPRGFSPSMRQHLDSKTLLYDRGTQQGFE